MSIPSLIVWNIVRFLQQEKKSSLMFLLNKNGKYCWAKTGKYIHTLGLNIFKNMEYELWVIYAYFNILLYVSLFLLSLLLGPHCLYWLLKFNFFLHYLKIPDHMAEANGCLWGDSNENGVVSNLVYLIKMATIQKSSIPILEFLLFITLLLSGKLQIYSL